MDRTNAERQRRYIQRLKARAGSVSDASDPGKTAALEQELLAAKARIAELEARLRERPNPGGGDEVAVLKRELAEVEQQRDTALAERTSLHKMLDDGHRVIAEAKAILAAKAFMPAEVFKTLLYSAHEDRVTDPRWKVRYRTAFQFLKEHERMLAKKPLPPLSDGLPRTPEEWEARKWQVKEDRKAKRAAAKRAKANPPKSLR